MTPPADHTKRGLTGECLDHQRKDVLLEAPPARARCDVNDTVKKRVPEQPIAIVEIRDHMAQKDVISLLATKKDAKRCNV